MKAPRVLMPRCKCQSFRAMKLQYYSRLHAVDSRYSGSLKYGHLDIPTIWFGTDC